MAYNLPQTQGGGSHALQVDLHDEDLLESEDGGLPLTALYLASMPDNEALSLLQGIALDEVRRALYCL